MCFLPWQKVHRLLLTDFRFVGLSPTARLVYFQLLLTVDSTGALPGDVSSLSGVIARVTGISASAASKALGQLRTAGLVVPSGDRFRVVSTSELYDGAAGGYITGLDDSTDQATNQDETPDEAKRRATRERVKKHRNKSSVTDSVTGSVTCNADVTQNVTPESVTENVTENVTSVTNSSSLEKKRKEEDKTKDRENKELEKKDLPENVTGQPKNDESFSISETKVFENSSSSEQKVSTDEAKLSKSSSTILALVEENPSSKKPKVNPQVLQVFDHWREKTKHPRAKLDPARVRCIEKAIESHGVDRCLKAVDGCAGSKWHCENKVNEITFILRNASRIEEFEAKADIGPPKLSMVFHEDEDPFAPGVE